MNTKKLEIVEKGWRLNASKFDQYWYYDHITVNAETRGEAKSKLLSEVWDAKFMHSDDEITFLNIPVVRAKEFDRVIFDGEVTTRSQAEYRIKDRERSTKLDNLLKDNPNSFAYILKRGQYYRPNSCGYTDYKTRAGVYTLEEAIRSVKGSSLGDNMQAVVIDVNEHNEMLNKEINGLKSRLL